MKRWNAYKKNWVCCGLVYMGFFCLSHVAAGQNSNVIYVKADAVGANDGTGWADAYTDLQDALAPAAPDDEIWVAAGIYTPSGRTLRTATFQLITGVSIYGGFAGTEVMSSERDPAKNLTILSGDLLGNDLEVSEPSDLARESTRSDNSFHVVTGTAADETGVLDGFVVIGGNANGPEHLNGGGMINKWKDAQSGRNGTIGPFPASPTLVNCTFLGNSADRNGGAVYNERGMPTFIDCVFNANHADGGDFEEGGGGIYNERGDLILRGCRFGENTSTGGAGLYNKNASPIVIDTVFDRNAIIGFSHDNNGGGILNSGSDATIINCTFTDNLASFGGGIWNYSAPAATIVNCIFSRNEAGHPSDGAGGGLQNWTSNPTVINCTFSENSAVTIAGGLGEGGGSRTTVSNCIFWANSAKSAPQIGGGTTDVTHSCVQGGRSGEGNIDVDPHFVDSQDGDFRLKSEAGHWNSVSQSWVPDDVTSRCIDAGDPMSPIGLEPFPTGGFVNMGAYGGTAEASKAYFGTEPCDTVMAGDINGDCQVDRIDLEIMALHWTDPEPLQQ